MTTASTTLLSFPSPSINENVRTTSMIKRTNTSTTFSAVMNAKDSHNFLEPPLPRIPSSTLEDDHEDLDSQNSPKPLDDNHHSEEADFCMDFSTDMHSRSPPSSPTVPGSFLLNANSNSQNATFFPGAATESSEVISSHQNTSVTTTSCGSNNVVNAAPSTSSNHRDILDDNSNGSVLGVSNTEIEEHEHSPHVNKSSKSSKKSVWDFVVEQIKNYGINQVWSIWIFIFVAASLHVVVVVHLV